MKDFESELFEIVKRNDGSLKLFNEIKPLLEKVNRHSACLEKSRSYGILTRLLNSINNAGHEERRSNDISFMWEEQKSIQDFLGEQAEEYLP